MSSKQENSPLALMLAQPGGAQPTDKFFFTGRRMMIPDVNERTNNDPCYLMSSNDVLKLVKVMHSSIHEDASKTVITPDIIAGVIKEATVHHGWSEVRQYGKQLLFIK